MSRYAETGRVHNFAISVDGYGAGPSQSLDDPLGVGGPRLHEWAFATRYGRRMIGEEVGDEGIDERFMVAGDTGIGATIMGRNMFGPVRGRLRPDEEWQGWRGDDPPYHHPVFVLMRDSRPSLVMQGGTTFNFATDGPRRRCRGRSRRREAPTSGLGGGVATIQHTCTPVPSTSPQVAIVSIFLGGGERLFDGLDGGPVGYENVEMVGSASVTHVRFVRQ